MSEQTTPPRPAAPPAAGLASALIGLGWLILVAGAGLLAARAMGWTYVNFHPGAFGLLGGGLAIIGYRLRRRGR